MIRSFKQKAYARASGSFYFRRTYDGQEIDCVYSSGNKAPKQGREIKRTKPSKRKIPHAFSTNYPDSTIAVLTPDSCKQIFASFVSSQLPWPVVNCSQKTEKFALPVQKIS